MISKSQAFHSTLLLFTLLLSGLAEASICHMPGCQSCQPSSTICTACEAGYRLRSASCLECSWPCRRCDASSCSLCDDGYTVVAGKCVKSAGRPRASSSSSSSMKWPVYGFVIFFVICGVCGKVCRRGGRLGRGRVRNNLRVQNNRRNNLADDRRNNGNYFMPPTGPNQSQQIQGYQQTLAAPIGYNYPGTGHQIGSRIFEADQPLSTPQLPQDYPPGYSHHAVIGYPRQPIAYQPTPMTTLTLVHNTTDYPTMPDKC